VASQADFLMNVDVDIEVDDAKTRQRLRMMEVRSKNFTPVFERAKQELERSNRTNFLSNGLPVGGWKPRTAVYAWPIMRRTGKLFNSLANLAGPENVVTPMAAQFGTDVEYAKFHQYGTEKMAKRQILFTPRTFAENVASEAGAWVSRGGF
jgi:phage gpG-like protein